MSKKLGVNEQFRNWIKGVLAIKCLHDGLVEFIDKETERQWDTNVKTIQNRCKLTSFDCKDCTIVNLLPEHASGSCLNNNRNECNCSKRKEKSTRACPLKGACGIFYDMVIGEHVKKQPKWDNTKVENWQNNHWEYAKCFIPGHGHIDDDNSANTDTAALLGICLNNNDIRGLLGDPDALEKSKSNRNELLHSGRMEITKERLAEMLANMKAVLSNAALSGYDSAKSAIETIVKLERDEIQVTIETDITARETALRSIVSKKKEIEKEIKDRENKVNKGIEADRENKDSGDIEKEMSINELHKEVVELTKAEEDHTISILKLLETLKDNVKTTQRSIEKHEDELKAIIEGLTSQNCLIETMRRDQIEHRQIIKDVHEGVKEVLVGLECLKKTKFVDEIPLPDMCGSFEQKLIERKQLSAKEMVVETLNETDIEDVKKGYRVLEKNRWTKDAVNVVPFKPIQGLNAKAKQELLQKYPLSDITSDDFSADLKPNPTKDCYKPWRHMMLFVEEYVQLKHISKYNMITHLKLTDLLPRLKVTDENILAESGHLFARIQLKDKFPVECHAGMLVLQNTNVVWLSPTSYNSSRDEKTVYEARIEVREDDYIDVELSKQCVLDLNLKRGQELPVEVQIQLNRLHLCEQHEAVDEIQIPDLVCPENFPALDVDIPAESRTSSQIDSHLNQCDVHQWDAISKCVSQMQRQSPPLLIVGPIGTGKTYTIAKCAEHALRNPENRVLICTHSKSEADIYIRDYVQHFYQDGNVEAKSLRIHDPNRRIETVPLDVRKFCLLQKDDISERIRFRAPTEKDIEDHRVIVTTIGSSSLLTRLNLKKGYFTHILLDEAAQTLESETLIPLSLSGPNTRVVLAGDHMQKSPEIFVKCAKQVQSNTSLLERLYNQYPKDSPYTIRLCKNYRTNQHIIEFMSRTLYEKVAAEKNPTQHPLFYPLTFYTTMGREICTNIKQGYGKHVENCQADMAPCKQQEGLTDNMQFSGHKLSSTGGCQVSEQTISTSNVPQPQLQNSMLYSHVPMQPPAFHLMPPSALMNPALFQKPGTHVYKLPHPDISFSPTVLQSVLQPFGLNQNTSPQQGNFFGNNMMNMSGGANCGSMEENRPNARQHFNPGFMVSNMYGGNTQTQILGSPFLCFIPTMTQTTPPQNMAGFFNANHSSTQEMTIPSQSNLGTCEMEGSWTLLSNEHLTSAIPPLPDSRNTQDNLKGHLVQNSATNLFDIHRICPETTIEPPTRKSSCDAQNVKTDKDLPKGGTLASPLRRSQVSEGINRASNQRNNEGSKTEIDIANNIYAAEKATEISFKSHELSDQRDARENKEYIVGEASNCTKDLSQLRKLPPFTISSGADQIMNETKIHGTGSSNDEHVQTAAQTRAGSGIHNTFKRDPEVRRVRSYSEIVKSRSNTPDGHKSAETQRNIPYRTRQPITSETFTPLQVNISNMTKGKSSNKQNVRKGVAATCQTSVTKSCSTRMFFDCDTSCQSLTRSARTPEKANGTNIEPTKENIAIRTGNDNSPRFPYMRDDTECGTSIKINKNTSNYERKSTEMVVSHNIEIGRERPKEKGLIRESAAELDVAVKERALIQRKCPPSWADIVRENHQ